MWGEGYLLPSGGRFELQFEPFGRPKDAGPCCRRYEYRRKLEGRGVSVSLEEFDELKRKFHRRRVWRLFLTIVVYFVFSSPAFIAEYFFDFGSWSGVSLLVGLIPAALYWFRHRKQDRREIDESLAGRRKVGRNRSPEEAKILWFALTGWEPIGRWLLIIGTPTAAILEKRPYPPPHYWIGLGPLAAAIAVWLGWWSILKARAVRYVDRNWCRPD